MRARGLLPAALALGVATCLVASCDETPTTVATATVAPVTTHAALRDNVRQLWTEQVAWTRFYMIGTVAGLADTGAAMERLLQNANDIGASLQPILGDSSGAQLEPLLQDRVAEVATLIGAANAGDVVGFNAALSDWHTTTDQIVAFLAAAMPTASPSELSATLGAEIDGLLAQLTTRLNMDWKGDIQAFDRTETQALAVADLVTADMATQFPYLVTVTNEPSVPAQAVQLDMRRLWMDRAIWTRVFVIDALADLPDTQPATERLLQNQIDIATEFAPYVNVRVELDLNAQLQHDVTLATEVVESAKIGDERHLQEALDAWDLSAVALGGTLAAASQSAADFQTPIQQEHDATYAQATDRLYQNWTTDVAQFDTAELHVTDVADAVSGGINAAFPNEGGD